MNPTVAWASLDVFAGALVAGRPNSTIGANELDRRAKRSRLMFPKW
jgi:hypothetical protein